MLNTRDTGVRLDSILMELKSSKKPYFNKIVQINIKSIYDVCCKGDRYRTIRERYREKAEREVRRMLK